MKTFHLFMRWLRGLFRVKAEAIAEGPCEAVPEASREDSREDSREVGTPACAPVEPAPITRRTRGPTLKKRASGLREILDNLDATWTNLARADEPLGGLCLPERDLEGLKRLGPLVIKRQQWRGMDDAPTAFKTSDALLPMTMFVAMNDGGAKLPGRPDAMAPDFAFAIKVRKLPWTVTKMRGQAFHFGMGWRAESGRVHWGLFYAYVHNGEITPASELCDHYAPLPRGGHVHHRTWQVSSWQHGREGSECVKAVFSRVIAIHETRLEHWNVAVNRGGRRATFLIDKKDTAYAFKDRDTTVLASDGKRKRIIHHVTAHTQTRADGRVVPIPEHIRGLREFDWNGYHCFVTSPQHHTFLTAGVPLAAEVLVDDDEPDMVDLPDLADLVVAAEERNNVRRAAHG